MLRIDREKSYVTNGGFAGLFTVLVRTPGLGGDRAHSLVCIPAWTPGIVRGAEEAKLGIRGSSTVTVTFDDVRVPVDHVLGSPGDGMGQANGLLAWGRTLMSAGCVGAARGALDATLAHVRARRQFGSPIGDFAATRAHVAWMAARTHAMEAMVASVGHAHAGGASIELDSTMAKVLCSEGAFEVCDRAVQLHGALGFLEQTGVPRILRDTRITRIFEGANDVLLLRIGAAVLGEAATEGPDSTHQLRELSGALRRETADVRARLGVGAVRHQLLLQRLARAAICERAARACFEHAGGEADGVAVHAAGLLADEAADWLARMRRADADERTARGVTDRIYPA
jgi:hypothetical protein